MTPWGRKSAHVCEEDLVRLAGGELEPNQEVQARAHLEACGRCRQALHEISRALEGYLEARSAQLEPQAPPIEVSRAELRRRLAAARARSAPWGEPFAFRPGRVHWALGLTALLIAVALATLMSWRAPIEKSMQADNASRRFAPDSRLTPGLTAAVSRTELCAAESDGPRTAIDPALAFEVFRMYGIADPQPRAYEVDFLIPPELGGARDVRNLWPQPYDVHPWNAHAKDALEDYLRRSVCDGGLDLADAQRELAEGWITAYQRRFRTREPLVEHAGFLKDAPWE